MTVAQRIEKLRTVNNPDFKLESEKSGLEELIKSKRNTPVNDEANES